MDASKPTVLVTGIAGNLGLRLWPLLADYQVVGVDLNPPAASPSLSFQPLDLALEESCRELFLLLKKVRPFAVLHLAFVIDPLRSGVLDLDRMWQINVAGTARVMEAITEANRTDPIVKKFLFPSSVSAYGSDLPAPATEDSPLAAHTLPYAIHKMESDRVVQLRAPALRGCSVYLLRPHIFAGASMQNYLIGAFRGTPNGRGKRAAEMRAQGKRLSCMLPYGQRYLDNKIQFVHVDDMARLLAYIVHKTEPEAQRLTILNVAGRGQPLTFAQCIEMAHAKLVRVPGKWAFRQVLEFLWRLGISAIPPEALPYMTGEYTMNTERLHRFLGDDHENVIRYTIADAFADSFTSL
ncbi:NAD-dependent epimerase/dehydratase [Candidatus Sulfotelmatobacter sp. SbA7]|nr:NAD-dependent epimerase/dehydratase [Candidatus Sulfotelmatobacter sp. SbA7]